MDLQDLPLIHFIIMLLYLFSDVNCTWFYLIDFEMDEAKQHRSRSTRSKRGRYAWYYFGRGFITCITAFERRMWNEVEVDVGVCI